MGADHSTVTEEPPNIISFDQAPTSERTEGKLDEVLEELKTVKTQLEELKPPKLPIEEPTPQITEEIESDKKKQEIVDPSVSKTFVLRQIFENMSGAEENKLMWNELEEYFGVKWAIATRRQNKKLGCYLLCEWLETEKKRSIETEFQVKICGPNTHFYSKNATYCFSELGGYGSCMEWDDMEKNYLIDDKLRVEIHVKIKRTTGIYKENLRKFDESMQEFSDVTLTVGEEKFYVSKLYLAAQSSYFKALFLGKFKESKKSEIAFTGVDQADFQKYLEVLYGESAIEESSVESILLVAEFYDTPIVAQKCEEFLLKEARTTLKKKLQMAFRYNLENLKKKGLSDIKTFVDVRSVTPVNIENMDPSLIALLFQKSISF